MSSVESLTCAVCGDVAESASEHSVHATLAHPELNRRALRERRAAGKPSAAARPVSCWSCAALIPSDAEACVCGKPRPDFQAFGNTDRCVFVRVDEGALETGLLEDRHSRPSVRFPGPA